ncbi:MAG: tRNA lysidine(34) synthetase TilS [Maricaulis sp.]|nr:tRNA lysidine(34) synthetase TilS [Maricaulis sp.]
MPLGAETAARLDSLVTTDGPVLVGLSGGADSRTLLILAARWARMTGRDVHALVADHALRRESAAEAARAAAMAEADGIPVRIVRRTGPAPETGLQAAARQFRLKALADEARRVGARIIVLGHTADDRAENLWMRLTAGGGLSGLSGMRPASPHPLWPEGHGLTLVRPLIDQTRAGIRRWLQSQRHDWIDDPSNADRRFTRVRVRQTLTGLAARGVDTARLSRLADTLARIDDERSEAAGHAFHRGIALMPWGGARIDTDALAALTGTIRPKVIAAAIAAVSGIPLPAAKAVQAISTALASGSAASGGGAALTHWRGGTWLVREPGRSLPKSVTLQAGADVTWDGRWQCEASGTGLEIAPLGRDYRGYAHSDRLGDVPGMARSTLVALRNGGTVLAVAGLNAVPGVTMTPLHERLAERTLFAGIAPAWFDRIETQSPCDDGARNMECEPPYQAGSTLEPLRNWRT